MAIVEHCEQLKAELLSDKLTKRKEGFRHLNQILDSDALLRALDESTLRLLPTDKHLSVDTWPGLCTILIQCVGRELGPISGKKRGPEATVSKTFRRFVQTADDEHRSGRSGMLGRKIAKLFTHVKDVLSRAGASSPFGADYSSVLRSNLLTNAHYCSLVPTSTFQELLSIYMTKLEDSPLDRSEDTFRTISMVHLLLQNFQGDMANAFRIDTVGWLCEMFPRLHNLREDSRISIAFVAALNTFLLANGLDVCSKAAELHAAVHPFLMRAWRSARDTRLRDNLVLYLRIQLLLGGLEGPGDGHFLEEVQELVTHSMQQPGFSWSDESRGRGYRSSRHQLSLLELTSSVTLKLALQRKAAAPQCSDLRESSAKRRKVSHPQHLLLEQLIASPSSWGAVLALLLHRHGNQVEQQCKAEWLQLLSETFEEALKTLMSGKAPELAITWLLRFTAELAAAWPDHHRHTSFRAPLSVNKATTLTPAMQSQWQVIWDALVRWLSRDNAPSSHEALSAKEAAVMTVALILRKDLARSTASGNSLFRVPVMEQMLPATISLICSRFSSGYRGGAEEVTLRSGLLEMMLGDRAASVPSKLLCSGVAGALGLPSGGPWTGALQVEDQHTWWQQEDADNAVTEGLPGLMRGEDFVRERTEAMQAATGLPASGSQSMPDSVAIRLQCVAGTRVAALLGRLTGQQALKKGEAQLQELLSLCTVALSCKAALLGSAHGDEIRLDSSWRQNGAVSEAVGVAFGKCSRLLIAMVDGKSCVMGNTYSLLEDMVAALISTPDQQVLAGPWLGAVHELERLFNDADQASAAQLGSETQSALGSNGAVNAPALMFDDDLDLRATATIAGNDRPSSAGPRSSASLVAACRATCVRLLAILGSLHARVVANILGSYLEHCFNTEVLPPEGLTELIAEELSTVAAASRLPKLMLSAASGLDGHSGILLPRGFHNDTVCMVLHQLESLIHAYGHSRRDSSDSDEEADQCVESFVLVLESVLDRMPQADQHPTGGTQPSSSTRIALAKAVVALLGTVEASKLQPELLDECLEKLADLLQDPCYDARRHGTTIIPTLYGKWSDEQAMFETFKSKLYLHSLAAVHGQKSEGLRSEEHMETAALFLAETAVACGALEVEALLLLCAHAAQFAQHQSLVQALLQSIASRLGYASLPVYMSNHMVQLVFLWFGKKYPLQQFLNIQELVRVREGNVLDQKAFLESYSRALVPAMLKENRQDDIKEMAALLAMNPRTLLERNYEAIIGIAYPFYMTGNETDKGLARSIIQENLMGATFTEDERGKLFSDKIVLIIGQILLLVRECAHPPRPLVNVALGIEAIKALPGRPSREENRQILWEFVTGDAVAKLLLTVHINLQKGHCARHKLEALGPLQALLVFLDGHICTAHAFRHVVHILLQCLRVRELQEKCCRMLEDVLIRMQDQTDLQPLLGALLPTIISGLVTALETTREASRMHSRGPPAQSNKLVPLINNLILKALPGLHPYLQHVEPLPDMPELARAQQLLDRLRAGVSFCDELTHFVSRAASLPSVLLQRALASLDRGLATRQRELMADAGPRPCKPQVEKAAWQLVWLARDLGNSDLAAFTGKLLALFGPLDPHVIAFSIPSSTGNFSGAADRTAQFGRSSRAGSSATNKVDSLQAVLTQALQLLVVYLVDQNVPFIKHVHIALRQLLTIPQGLAAMQHLEPLQQAYLQVFAAPKRAANIPEPTARADLEDGQLWQLEGQTYDEWVCGLADALLGFVSSPLLHILQRCARRKPAMAELLLPHIFADLAAHDSDATLMVTVSKQVSKNIIQAKGADVKAIRLILNVLNFLRGEQQDFIMTGRPYRGKSGQISPDVADPTLWKKVCWLDLDYLHLAGAALHCSAAFTALLYVEFWCKENHGRLTLGEQDVLSEGGLSTVDQLLLDIYSQIQEPDGIYAAARSQKAASQLCLFEHEGAWDKALVGYDLLQLGDHSTQQPSDNHFGLLNSLQQLGCQHTLGAYWASLPQTFPSGSRTFWEKRFEMAWRMGDWQEAAELQAPLPDAGDSAPFHQAICTSLKALNDGDSDTLLSTLHMARASVIQELATISTESAASINPALMRLQMLEGLADASGLQGSRQGRDRATAAHALEEKWVQGNTSLLSTNGRYELLEPLLSLQRTLASALDMPNAAVTVLLQRACLARKSGRLTNAMGSLHALQSALRKLDAGQFGAPMSWRMEEAKLLWAQGQHSMAIQLGRALLNKMKADAHGDAEQLTRLQSLLGKWLAWNRSESSAAVLEMMQQALQRVSRSSSQPPPEGKVVCRAAYRLAHYADSMYCSVQKQRNSPEWATAQAVIQQKMQQMAQWQAQFDERRKRGDMKVSADGTVLDKESRQLWHHINSLKRPVEADKQEQAALSASELKYRDIAMTNYRRCLLAGNAYNLPVIFRLCQLWFSLGAEKEVARQMAAAAGEVPSWKFLPLVYQLASRLSCGFRSRPLDDSGFTATLAVLMQRLASEHPHHTLHCLLALKNGNCGRDGRRADAPGRTSRDALVHSVDFDKVAAAEDVLNAVAKKPTLKEIVAQVGQMAEAYIELAAVPAPDKANDMPFPSPIRRSTKALNKVPVVSVSIPVDPSCSYSGLACFSHFGEGITFVGGINKPKLVQCFDSAGVRHRQLVKSGNDDLRQDAVMQQFFSLINDLLAQSMETRKRCLNIVTYKVVPFSPAAGLLEWVEDTEPLGTYLTGKDRTSGAHARYARPGDYSFFDAYNVISKCKPQNLRKAYDDVCAHFTPCLHNFFLENFRQPAAWFEKRLAYTRATAVNSMAGYLIGLGDRHFHNILIDKRSAEVVHIDLGVAFEQGRFLNTPELVPFRLTRDVVDGMGATGVEGVMRKCCEETLRVLRLHKESLLTIVEVFIHDPLYRWALTPANAHQRQVSSMGDAAAFPELDQLQDGAEEGIANADAKRTLLRVKQKLEGLDGGEGEAKSVEGQVQQLLQEAQDPDRLCRMFVGWASWL